VIPNLTGSRLQAKGHDQTADTAIRKGRFDVQHSSESMQGSTNSVNAVTTS